MRQILKRLLVKNPDLFNLAQNIHRSLTTRCRAVELSTNTLPEKMIREIKENPYYYDILNDLIAYTGFSPENLRHYILRYPEKHFESEFNWYNPKDSVELGWFYRCSSGYLFANSAHHYQEVLNTIKEGRVLDYGAGTGCNTIGLAMRGVQVDFLEISRIQADFINFRAYRRKLKNIREILPYHDGKFDAIRCVTEDYDAVIAMDVLEHIPDYHLAVQHLIGRLKPSGIFIEKSGFDETAAEIAIHLRASIPLQDAMTGMEQVSPGIWLKKPA